MANPRPLYFTTGNYATRNDLRRAITTLRRFNLGWEEIGKTVGVSERTAKRVFDEAEAERKECRVQGPSGSSEQLCGGTVTAEQATSLPTAVKVYAMLVIALILLAAAVAFNR